MPSLTQVSTSTHKAYGALTGSSPWEAHPAHHNFTPRGCEGLKFFPSWTKQCPYLHREVIYKHKDTALFEFRKTDNLMPIRRQRIQLIMVHSLFRHHKATSSSLFVLKRNDLKLCSQKQGARCTEYDTTFCKKMHTTFVPLICVCSRNKIIKV